MAKLLTNALVASLLVVALAASPADATFVRTCHYRGLIANGAFVLTSMKTFDFTCKAARRIAAKFIHLGRAPAGWRTYEPERASEGFGLSATQSHSAFVFNGHYTSE